MNLKVTLGIVHKDTKDMQCSKTFQRRKNSFFCTFNSREKISKIQTHISEIKARNLHNTTPRTHGYCCQNT